MMQSITEAIEKIPILPALIEQLTGQALSMFLEESGSCPSLNSTLIKHRPAEHVRLFAACAIRSSNHQPGQNRTQHRILRNHREQQRKAIDRIP